MNELTAQIIDCIDIQAENSQYLTRAAQGLGSDVWSALDDAMMQLSEASKLYPELELAIEQLMQDYSGSANYSIQPRIYWSSDRPNESRVEFDGVEVARMHAAEPETDVHGTTTIDGLFLDSSDYAGIIPDSTLSDIQSGLDNCELYFYVHVDLKAIRQLIAESKQVI